MLIRKNYFDFQSEIQTEKQPRQGWVKRVLNLLGGVDKMAQRAKVPATKPENLSLIPRTYMVERKNQLLKVAL